MDLDRCDRSTPEPPAALGAADFHPVVIAPAPSSTPTTATTLTLPSAAPPISDFGTGPRSFAPRPTPAQPNVAKAVIKEPPHPRLTGKHASGSATWYCQAGVSVCAAGYPGGLYAAAGPELRVGAWRGRIVRVCGSGHCVWVKLIDWCACGGSHLIDLYSDAFRRLAPTSAGAVRVTVSW